MKLATTMQESIAARRNLLRDALYYRRNGMRLLKRSALTGAAIEKLNQKYFLGEVPF